MFLALIHFLQLYSALFDLLICLSMHDKHLDSLCVVHLWLNKVFDVLLDILNLQLINLMHFNVVENYHLIFRLEDKSSSH